MILQISTEGDGRVFARLLKKECKQTFPRGFHHCVWNLKAESGNISGIGDLTGLIRVLRVLLCLCHEDPQLQETITTSKTQHNCLRQDASTRARHWAPSPTPLLPSGVRHSAPSPPSSPWSTQQDLLRVLLCPCHEALQLQGIIITSKTQHNW